MDLYTSLYVGVCLAVLVWHVRRRRRLEHQSAKAQDKTGAAEPASLHPVISDHCICCSSCIEACPAQAHHTLLGLLRGRAHLVSPGDCIGHGARQTACPVDAITWDCYCECRGPDIPL